MGIIRDLFSDFEEITMTVHNTDIMQIKEAIINALVRGGFSSLIKKEYSIKANYRKLTICGDIEFNIEVGDETSVIKYVVSARTDNVYAKFNPPIPVIQERFVSNFHIEERKNIKIGNFNFCPFCGESLIENARFCTKCGSKIL